MNKLFTRLMLMVLCLCSSGIVWAQGAPGSEELMRSNGKIYVVVAVCLTILIGLFLYVYSVDRKISKIEKNN
jgi:tetrahydromethanopterin S-methyltransferase subunit D